MTARFRYSAARHPPIPAVTLDLVSEDGSRAIHGLEGQLDTAADVTVVPLPLLARLGVTPVRHVPAHGFGGAAYTLGMYRVRLRIPNVGDLSLEVLGHSAEDAVLVGRDVLNRYRVTFDGPNLVAEFH
jgi:hypothetical protein